MLIKYNFFEKNMLCNLFFFVLVFFDVGVFDLYVMLIKFLKDLVNILMILNMFFFLFVLFWILVIFLLSMVVNIVMRVKRI